jgi:competence protein ComEC
VNWFHQLKNILKSWPILNLLALQFALAFAIETQSLWVCTALAILFVFVTILHFRKAIWIPCLCLILILLSAGHHFYSQKPISENIFPKKVTYLAVVVGEPLVLENKTRLVVDLQQRINPMPDLVAGRIQITIGEACQWQSPEEIVFTAKIYEQVSFRNPGVFNYQRYLQRRNIWAKSYVETCDGVEVKSIKKLGILASTRKQFLAAITGRHAPILKALILGVRGLGQETKLLIRESGLSHLFVISGTHFGILSALFYGLVFWGLYFFPRLFLYYPRQKIASSVTLFFVIFYLLLVTPHASVLRAGLMVSLYFVSVLLNRRPSLFYMLCLAASINLMIHPLDLWSVSFQLSYLCICLLLLMNRFFMPWLRLKLQPFPRMFRYLLNLLAISIFLNLALVPIILYHFGAAPLNGVIHNLWAVPYFSFVLLPLSLSYLLFFWLDPLREIILNLFNGSVDVFLTILQGLPVSLPSLDGFSPHFIHLAAFYMALVGFFLGRGWKVRAFGITALVLLLSYTYLYQVIGFDLKMTQIDVGQGDAIFIQTPEKNMLIDTGGSPYFDIGKRVLIPFFKHEWVKSIDIVVLTHADIDHYAGIEGLIEKNMVREVWINQHFAETEAYQSLLTSLKQKQVKVKVVAVGEVIKLSEEVITKVVSTGADKAITDNDASLVVQVNHAHFKALFTGDMTKLAEYELVSNNKNIAADYLKVAHHGSKTSTSSLFLDHVNPKWASIGVGQNSRFGHPHRQVMDRLNKRGVKVYRTDQKGAVSFMVKSDRISVTTFK